MIFSDKNWNRAKEMTPYIGVSNGLEFETVKAPLQNAFTLFIRPLLGDTLTTTLVRTYNDISDISTISENSEDLNMHFVYLAQRSNAFLAFWYDYDEMQVLIDNSGSKRQESDQTKTPYKYQEQSLKDGWKNKGFDSLDNLLCFLEENINTFPEFKTSTYYTEARSSIVRDTNDVNAYYSINSSRLTFLRLKSNFRVIEDVFIQPRLGDTLYNELKKALLEDTVEDKYKTLRDKLVPVIVFYSISRLIRETGSITDKGLFFQSLQGGESSYIAQHLVDSADAVSQANRAEGDAISYWLIVEKYLQKEFGVKRSHSKKTPNRNNNGRKSYWG